MSASTAGPARLVAGVDIGGTTTQVVLCEPETLTVLDRLETPTPARQGAPAILGTVLDSLAALRQRFDGAHELLAIGVGAAGVVDTAAGRVLVTSDSFTGWAGAEVTTTLTDALDVPAYLDNDVNAFLRGETARGAAVGEPHVLGITLGTGVGGALWLDGRLFDGPHGAAGEIGHVPGFGDLRCSCGGHGHLETVASGRALAARYHDRTGRTLTAAEIAHAADTGDPDAAAVFTAAGTALARAVLITAGLIDVTTVVIGGGVSRAWHLLEPPIREALRTEPPVSGNPIRLLRAALASDAVALGAAARARDAATAPVG